MIMAKDENAVAPSVFGGVTMTAEARKAAAERMAESANNSASGGDTNFLNYSGKKDRYECGADKRQVGPDELWLLNISSFEDGWIMWKGGTPAAKRFANVMDTPVATPDADEGGPFTSNQDGWFQGKAMALKSLDQDEQAHFSTNSKSGVSSVAALQKEVAQKMLAGEDCWPVITLRSESFTSGGFTNTKPVFHVEAWLSDANIEALAGGDADIDALVSAGTTAPKRKRRL